MAWGNGGCSDDGWSSRFRLLEIASHSNLVIASGRILSGPEALPCADIAIAKTPSATVRIVLGLELDRDLRP